MNEYTILYDKYTSIIIKKHSGDVSNGLTRSAS